MTHLQPHPPASPFPWQKLIISNPVQTRESWDFQQYLSPVSMLYQEHWHHKLKEKQMFILRAKKEETHSETLDKQTKADGDCTDCTSAGPSQVLPGIKVALSNLPRVSLGKEVPTCKSTSTPPPSLRLSTVLLPQTHLMQMAHFQKAQQALFTQLSDHSQLACSALLRSARPCCVLLWQMPVQGLGGRNTASRATREYENGDIPSGGGDARLSFFSFVWNFFLKNLDQVDIPASFFTGEDIIPRRFGYTII